MALTNEQGNFFFQFEKEFTEFLRSGSDLFEIHGDIICHEVPAPLNTLLDRCNHDSEFVQIRKTDLSIYFVEDTTLDITFLTVRCFFTKSSAHYLNGIWIVPYKSNDNTTQVKVCFHFPLNKGKNVFYNLFSEEKYIQSSDRLTNVPRAYRCVYALLDPTFNGLKKENVLQPNSSFDDYISDIFEECFYYYQ